MCRICPPSVEEMKGYWLERFTDDEITTVVEGMLLLPFGTLNPAVVAEARSRVTAP